MLNRYFLSLVLVIASLAGLNKSVMAINCGDVSIANLSWMSAQVIAQVDRLILGEGYGCNVELVSGDTMQTFEDMNDNGKPDIFPEFWVNSVRVELEASVEDGSLVVASEVLAEGGKEGWWIPRYLAEAHPEIRSVTDALAHPELFISPDDDSLSPIYNCPSTWSCHISTANLFKAFDAENKGFTLVDTGSAAGLDASIVTAHEQNAGWLGYYWEPTPLMGRYEMIRLDMPAHDSEHWSTCITVAECEEPRVVGWPRNDVVSVVSRAFNDSDTDAVKYVSARQLDIATVNKLLAWMTENQATGEEVAIHFLKNYEYLWSDWVSDDASARVKASLRLL